MKTRVYTVKLLEEAEAGVISWETIARAALGYMSEDEVEDMAISEGFDVAEGYDEEDEDA